MTRILEDTEYVMKRKADVFDNWKRLINTGYNIEGIDFLYSLNLQRTPI
jgi:hypothetical protein